ncbi:hypothetical protein GTR02_03955 [Kineococcus sp. R8]|uniref:hypothetical protein n=1 Tax=Kineococcus siccus TaxID=2696567 RepID=UPI0014126B00|nr:hypothetical protein [Kineococcus siccus]NAZ80968.1 hypothetical protein [Kineococcus siccus]
MFTDTWRTLTTTLSDTSGATATRVDHHDSELATRRARRLDVVAAQQVRARHRRRLARVSAITLTLAVASAGTAAAATYLAAHTGQHTSGWEATAAGPGEVLRQDGSDYLDVAAQLTADIPFSADHQAQRQAQFRAGSLAPGTDAQITVSALRAQVAQNAICTWADAWIAADTTGHSTVDVSARRTATSTLTASLTWSAVTDVDPTPSASGARADAGAETGTRFGWVPAIATAAAAGDRAAVLGAVAASDRCSPAMTPAITAAVTTAATIIGQGSTR